jgi:uncharacterized protein YunC (DUF1805 family)
MEKISFNNIEFNAGKIELAGVNILLINAAKGSLGCAYLNLAAAEKFGHALAIVSGVSSYDDMFNAEVRSISKAAADLGVSVGMSGFEALKLMN